MLISTINDGILTVENFLMKPRDENSYIISHHYTHQKFRAIPPFLERPDVTISQIQGKGLSKSRNNALRLATADIALIADDDAKYCDDYIDTVIVLFSTHSMLPFSKPKVESREPEYKQYSSIKV